MACAASVLQRCLHRRHLLNAYPVQRRFEQQVEGPGSIADVGQMRYDESAGDGGVSERRAGPVVRRAV